MIQRLVIIGLWAVFVFSTAALAADGSDRLAVVAGTSLIADIYSVSKGFSTSTQKSGCL